MNFNPQSENKPGKVHAFKYDKGRDGLAFGIVFDGTGFIMEFMGEEIDRLLLALHEGGFEGLQPTDKTVRRHGPHGAAE